MNAVHQSLPNKYSRVIALRSLMKAKAHASPSLSSKTVKKKVKRKVIDRRQRTMSFEANRSPKVKSMRFSSPQTSKTKLQIKYHTPVMNIRNRKKHSKQESL